MQAYEYDGFAAAAPGQAADARYTIVVINPSKERMSPLVMDAAKRTSNWAANDIMTEWRQ
jgi:hypothetical protein